MRFVKKYYVLKKDASFYRLYNITIVWWILYFFVWRACYVHQYCRHHVYFYIIYTACRLMSSRTVIRNTHVPRTCNINSFIFARRMYNRYNMYLFIIRIIYSIPYHYAVCAQRYCYIVYEKLSIMTRFRVSHWRVYNIMSSLFVLVKISWKQLCIISLCGEVI